MSYQQSELNQAGSGSVEPLAFDPVSFENPILQTPRTEKARRRNSGGESMGLLSNNSSTKKGTKATQSATTASSGKKRDQKHKKKTSTIMDDEELREIGVNDRSSQPDTSSKPTTKDYLSYLYLVLQTITVGAPLYGFMSAFPQGNKVMSFPLQLKMFQNMLLVQQIASFPSSVINDIFGPKKVAILCMSIMSAGLLFLAVGMQNVNYQTDMDMSPVLLLSTILLGLAAPMQITSMQLTLLKLFPKVCTNLTTTIINGSYDTSSFMFGLMYNIGFAIFTAEHSGSTNTGGDAKVAKEEHMTFVDMMYAYMVIAILHLIGVVFIYPNTNTCVSKKNKSDETSGEENEEDSRALLDNAGTSAGGNSMPNARVGDLEGSAQNEETNATPELSTAERLKLEKDPNSWPNSWPFSKIITQLDFWTYCLWFSCQFFTFSNYLATQITFFDAEMMNLAGYFNYVLGIPAAFLIGFIFSRTNPKSQAMTLTSFLGIVFQIILCFLVELGKIDITAQGKTTNLQWIIFPALGVYRAAMFSALWIYFPTIYGIGRLGGVYGLALSVSAGYCAFVTRVIAPDISAESLTTDDKQKMLKSFNLKWLAFLVANALIYFVYTKWSDRHWRKIGRHTKREW